MLLLRRFVNKHVLEAVCCVCCVGRAGKSVSVYVSVKSGDLRLRR
jgi:hypothetical protein